MPWPLSQDYNEAIQNPAAVFSDPELKQTEPATNALGLPMPCSGNFADVYELRGPKKKWAVKCFTREIPGIRFTVGEGQLRTWSISPDVKFVVGIYQDKIMEIWKMPALP